MNKWNNLFLKRPKGKDRKKIVIKVLKELGFVKNFKIFNVVGTNGKGSVSKYLTDSFIAHGDKVGTFTSPHIHKPNERIKINNKNISNKDFWNIADKFNLSFFETLYVVAMLHFQHKAVDIAIVEAGIGGKFDTTNFVDGDYGVVTSIGLDHTELLGNTTLKIAKDKSGIINKGMKFYVPSTLAPSLRKEFKGKLIKNEGPSYKEENINLAKGILKDLKINPVINDVEGRTEIIKKNETTYILDVAHNLNGIEATVKHLKSKNIKYDNVVISMNKSKKIDGIKKLFKNKSVYIYKHDDQFHSEKNTGLNEIKDLDKFIKGQRSTTLYIGTFRTISDIKKIINKKQYINNILFGKSGKRKLSISHMSIAAILISVAQILGFLLRFNLGPMSVSFDYIFYIVFGLLFGLTYGSLFVIINDLIKTVFVTGFGQWMWEYALIPIGIVLISSVFKAIIWNKNKGWLPTVISIMLLTNAFALLTVLVNNQTTTYTFRREHKEMIMLFYITFSLMFLAQASLITYYLSSKNKDFAKRTINIIVLIILVLVIMSWIWGPFAFLAYANRFIYKSPVTIKNKYMLFLIPRIIKTIPETAIWSIALIPVYELSRKVIDNASKHGW